MAIRSKNAQRLMSLFNADRLSNAATAVKYCQVYGVIGPAGWGWWAFPMGQNATLLGRSFPEALAGLRQDAAYRAELAQESAMPA